jgi:histidinol dehydrogenase
VEVERWSLQQVAEAGGPAGIVRKLREIVRVPPEIVRAVEKIVGDVQAGGDAALRGFIRSYDTDGAPPLPLLVEPERLEQALESLPLDMVAGLQVAIANVAEVASAGLAKDVAVPLAQGHTVTLREVPVQSAAVYVPGGRAPYPSTAVMGVVTARAAGVLDVVVSSPPGADGEIHPAILGVCKLLGVERVYRMGGAHAIAALALGTATIAAVDVIVGPGNVWVQEAKRDVADIVGIDGFAGPSDLMVVLGADAEPQPAALDLLAQAEHGAASLVVAVSPAREALDGLERSLTALADGEQRDDLAKCVLIEVADMHAAIALANSFAPEHLQLMGVEAERLAPQVRSAGCLLIGESSATAFGDYVAGSNHILPTGGAARFASTLSPRHFRRRMSEVRIGPDAAAKLAKAGMPIARAEGFEWHVRSMQARVRENPES